MAETTAPGRLPVRIVAVDREVWSGEATMLLATTLEGDLGIQPGHAPLLGQLEDPSAVKVFDGPIDSTPVQEYTVRGGYLSVTSEGVSVLVESAESPQ
jgi:F-type H+-transporting ATPase subunit epsilon